MLGQQRVVAEVFRLFLRRTLEQLDGSDFGEKRPEFHSS